MREGKVKGAILLGDGLTVPRVLQAFDRQEPLPENRSELLFPLIDIGSSGIGSTAANVEDLPDDAQICGCNGVTKGKILAAANSGNRTMQEVCAVTRAGSGCGSCKEQVQAVLELAGETISAGDGSDDHYVSSIALTKPELTGAIKAMKLKSVAAVIAALSDGAADAAVDAALASLLVEIWGDASGEEIGATFARGGVSTEVATWQSERAIAASEPVAEAIPYR